MFHKDINIAKTLVIDEHLWNSDDSNSWWWREHLTWRMEGFHIFQLVQVFFPSADIYTQKIFWWFASIESSIWKLSERTESAYYLLKNYSCFLSTNSHNPTTLLDRPGQQRESQRDRTAMPCEGWKGCHRMSFAPWSRENAILIGVWYLTHDFSRPHVLTL